MIELSLIGDCAVRIRDTRLTPDAERLFALVLYLAVGRGRRHPRRALQELLWPDASERSASHNLRQALYKLKLLGVPWRAVGDAIELDDEEVRPDALARLDAGAPPEEVLSLAPGDYLEGYAPGFSAGFAEWVEEQRGSAHVRIVRGLLVVLAGCRSQGRWSDMDVVARACLRLDPLHEEATLARAEAAAMGGSKARALSILDRYLEDVGPEAAARIQLPVSLLRRRIAERQAPRYPAPGDSCFVGREASMAFVTAALADARAGRGRATLVWGSPGIGKTRLGIEVSGLAALQGVQSFTITCYERDVSRPLAAFVNFTAGLLGLRGALGCSEESMGYLRRLTELPGEQPPDVEPPDAVTLHAAVRQSVVDLVEAIAEEAPLLLIVDDAQWLDPVSSAVLRTMALGAGRRRLLLLFLTRAPQVGVPGEADGVTERHPLLPLDDAAAAALARAITGQAVPAPGDTLIAWWVRTAGGSPFFLRELAAQWLETGREYVVPPTVGAVVEDRLARLDGTALRVLQTCAALGHSGTVERLASVLGHPGHVMLDAVTTLERAGFVIVSSAGLLQRHALGGDRALALLGEGSRRLLHRSCAQAIEAEIRSTPGAALAWECAEQWERAGEPLRALEVLLSCGRQVLSAGLSDDAASLFGEATKLCTTDAQRVICYRDHARALQSLGKWPEMLVEVERILELREESSEVGSDVVDDALHLEAELRLGRPTATMLPRAMGLARDPRLTPQWRAYFGWYALVIADQLCDKLAIDKCRRIVSPILSLPLIRESTAARLRAVYYTVCGELPDAGAAARELRNLAFCEQDPHFAGYLLRNSAATFTMCGEHDFALDALSRALAIASERGLKHAQATACALIATIMLDTGSDEEAVIWSETAALIAHDVADTRLISIADWIAARLALARGEIARASTLLSALRRGSIADIRQQLAYEAMDFRVRLAHGEPIPSEDISDFRRSVDAIIDMGRLDFEYATIVLLLREQGSTAEAAQTLRQYCEVRREIGPLPSELRRLAVKRDWQPNGREILG